VIESCPITFRSRARYKGFNQDDKNIMTLDIFEQKLKEIDPRLRIVPHPSNEDVAGIYCEDMFVITIPAKDIYEDVRKNYRDRYGRVHRNSVDAEGITRTFLERIKDPTYLKFARGEEE
jgi:hypothetical protein